MQLSALSTDDARRALSPALVRELEQQNRVLVPSAARERHLALLGDPELGVVVTGQQVGLFLGPAFTLYKAATAIVLARRLARESGRPTLPIFWLQSEDHDADEVASAAVLDEEDALATVTLAPSGPARASMAHRSLGRGVPGALDELTEHLAGGASRTVALELLARHYRPEASWVSAFAGALGEVFAEEGLLVLDPRTPAIAALATPLHRRALLEQATLDAALEEGAHLLEREGEAIAVRPRVGCSLTFFHADGPTGPRHRLVRRGGGFEHPHSGDRFSDEALLERLEREPLSFSTSSLLRVVLQDTLLPTVAQVAGPGEARYLRQLPPLSAAFGVRPPCVVPRARVVVTDPACRRRLDALGIAATDVGDLEPLLRALSQGDGGPAGDEVRGRLVGAVERELVALGPELEAIEPSLARALARTRAHVARGAERLGRRVERARAHRDATRVERVERLCRRLHPGGAPQERALAVPHFVARFGLRPLVHGLLGIIDEQLCRGELGRLRELAL